MSARKRGKIKTDGGDALGENPFGTLDSAGMPAGKMSEARHSDQPTVKRPQKSKGRVDIRREKAGRGGKTVTTLGGFPSHIPLATLEAMTFDLKKTCACGGTLKGRTIELQGDVCERVITELAERGYRPVRTGG